MTVPSHTLRLLQRGILLDHYEIKNSEELEYAANMLATHGVPHAADTINELLDVQRTSVPEGFEGPLMIPNMMDGYLPEVLHLDGSHTA